jgi:superfamily II DNA or RNA helicase
MRYYPKNQTEKEKLIAWNLKFKNGYFHLNEYQKNHIIKHQYVDISNLKEILKFPSMLFDHQVEAIKYFRKTDGRILMDYGTGLGKTRLSISIACLYNLNCTIICPANLIGQWEKEIDLCKKYYPNMPSFQISSFHVKNVGNKDLLVVDEAHNIKTRYKKFTARANRIKSLPKFKHYLFMSATPSPNNLKELFLYMNILNPQFYYDYKEFKYCMKDRIVDYLQPYYIRKRREEVQKLPPKREEIIKLPKPDGYDDINEPHPLSKKTKQISFLSEKAIPHVINVRKEYANRKVLIVSHRLETIKKLSKQLNCPCIIGSIPPKEREKIRVSDWDTLILSFKLAVGLNLQRASVIIFVEPDYTEDYVTQAIARIYRYGQKNDVIVIFILFDGTRFETIKAHAKRKKGKTELRTSDEYLNSIFKIWESICKSL